MKPPKKTAAALAPQTFVQWMQLADMMAKSSIVPTEFKDKPGDCLVAMQMGAAVGLNPFQAMQSIAVINGRPSLWGDGALAVVMAHPQFEWIDENESTDTVGVTVIKRKGMPALRYEFTLEMARTAGYLTKDTYKQNPKAMLQRRARARCMSATFADALKGIAFAEDVLHEKVVTGEELPAAAPRPKAKEVQDKLAARKADKPAEAKPAPTTIDNTTGEILTTLSTEEILKKLTEAKTKEELQTAADLARSIKDDEGKATAQAAYKTSLKRLRDLAA